MFYNCIEKTERQELNRLANLIEVKELDFSEFMLTSDEYEFFLPYFLKYQAI